MLSQDRKDLVASLLGSATAGSLARTLFHPIDTKKAKLQSSEQFKGFRDVTKQTLKKEGFFRGFYPGLGAVLIGGVPGICIYITSYDVCKKTLSQIKGSEHYEFLTYLSSGMFAESLCCLFFVPVDVVKERMQIQSNQYKTPYRGSWDALRTIIRREGVSGIYKGYFATLTSFGPFSALYFLFYEELKKELQRYREEKEQVPKNNSGNLSASTTDNLLCSTVASSVASFLTNPLDMAKLRFQVQRSEDAVATSLGKPYTGLVDVMRRIYAQQGILGLWRGVGARVLFHSPSTAITMTLYEECKQGWARFL